MQRMRRSAVVVMQARGLCYKCRPAPELHGQDLRRDRAPVAGGADLPRRSAVRDALTHRIADGEAYNVTRITIGAPPGDPRGRSRPISWRTGPPWTQLPLEILLGKARVVEVLVRETDRPVRPRGPRPARRPAGAPEDADVGPARRSAQFQEDYVYLTVDAADYLAQVGDQARGDRLPVRRDRFGTADYPSHHALLEAGVVIVEGLDLSEVEPGEYDMTCLPLRIVGAGGSPARVILRTRL